MNHCARHNYYVTKTLTWLRSCGYVADKVEYNHNVKIGDRNAYVKRDLWGADIAFRSSGLIGFAQVKTSPAQISHGVKQLSAGPWPPLVVRVVVYWPPRAKVPTLRAVQDEVSSGKKIQSLPGCGQGLS